MDDGKIQALFSDTSATESHGYGVRNINERLRLNCGPEFGLSYRSARGEGTSVTITIPAVI